MQIIYLPYHQKVFSFIQAVKDKGRSVIFIGHNIYHVYDIADRFAVLDRGKVVLEALKSEVPSAEILIQNMHSIARTGHIGAEPVELRGGIRLGDN